MRNLLDNLEEAGLSFGDVVATNVYLDDLFEFTAMNSLYAKYFSGVLPARTTVSKSRRWIERKGRMIAIREWSKFL